VQPLKSALSTDQTFKMSNQETNDGEELWAVADLCLIPMGLSDPSVGPQIAEVSIVACPFNRCSMRHDELSG